MRSEAGPGHGLVAERSGINLYSEYSLHAQIKEALAGPGDRLEATVEGRVVDLVKADGELVEVQTGGLGKIVPKILALAEAGRRLRVVYPVAVELSIRRLDPLTGEVASTRKSPKRGDLYSVFEELVKASRLIAAPGVAVEILLVRAAELRVRDGSGSWWRKGDRTVDRFLEAILSSTRLETRAEWLGLLPKGLAQPWTSSAVGERLGIEPSRARQLLYCLCKAGLLAEEGKEGRRKLYVKAKAPRKKAAGR